MLNWNQTSLFNLMRILLLLNADLDLNPAPNQSDAILSVTALPMAHLNSTDKLDRGPFFKLNFKGIPSQDKQKSDLRCLMILCMTLIG